MLLIFFLALDNVSSIRKRSVESRDCISWTWKSALALFYLHFGYEVMHLLRLVVD